MKNTDPFASPKALLERANRHISEFDDTSERYFRQPGSFEKFVDIDPTSGEELLKLRVLRDVPIGFACIVFDAIGCLRSALDHAVFSAVSIVGSTSAPEDIKFPFGETYSKAEEQFESIAKGVPANLRDFILDFLPYKGGDDILWGFNRIRNSKIHRALTPLAVASQSFAFNGKGSIGQFRNMNEWDASKLELTYARGRKVRVNIDITIRAAFGSTTALPLHPVNRTLSHVADVVAKVISGLETECWRINPSVRNTNVLPLLPMGALQRRLHLKSK